ncbi:MAG: sulfite exporter TauE/SafE family protein [Anaerolineales bacterium]
MVLLGLFGIGLGAGVLGALLGLGGGIFLVPALTLIFDLPIRIAVGASLVGVIATSAGVAVVAPRGRGADVGLALRLEVATTAGAIAGGYVAGLISPQVLSVLFALIVFFTAAYVFYKARRQVDAPESESLFRRDYRPHHWPAGLSPPIWPQERPPGPSGVYVLPRLRVTWLRTALIGLLFIMGVQMLLKGISA